MNLPGVATQSGWGVATGRTLPHRILYWLAICSAVVAAQLVFPLGFVWGAAVFFLMLGAGFGLWFWRLGRIPALAGVLIFVLLRPLYLILVDPLAGPDEIGFYRQVEVYDGYGAFFSAFQGHLREVLANPLARYSDPWFGFVFMPLYSFWERTDPQLIVLINSAMFLSGTWAICAMVARSKYVADGTKIAPWLALAMLMSPVFNYHSAIFAKDIAAYFLGAHAAYQFQKRRWLLSMVLLLFGTAVRPYMVVAVFVYIAVCDLPLKVLVLGAVGAVAFVLVRTAGNTTVLLNGVLITGYVFVSPFPLNASNYESYILPLTMEACVSALMLLALPIVALASSASRQLYVRCVVGIFVFALALTLVGYMNAAVARGLDYGLGSAGDNMVRKKLAVVPLVYIMLIQGVRILAGRIMRLRPRGAGYLPDTERSARRLAEAPTRAEIV